MIRPSLMRHETAVRREAQSGFQPGRLFDYSPNFQAHSWDGPRYRNIWVLVDYISPDKCIWPLHVCLTRYLGMLSMSAPQTSTPKHRERSRADGDRNLNSQSPQNLIPVDMTSIFRNGGIRMNLAWVVQDSFQKATSSISFEPVERSKQTQFTRYRTFPPVAFGIPAKQMESSRILLQVTPRRSVVRKLSTPYIARTLRSNGWVLMARIPIHTSGYPLLFSSWIPTKV